MDPLYRVAHTCSLDEGTEAYLMRCGREAGISIVRVPLVNQTQEEITKQLRGFCAAIVGAEPYREPILAALRKDLKVLCRFGSGYDSIDADLAGAMGIAVLTAAGGNSAAVAEHAIALMMTVSRRICQFDREMRRGEWNQWRAGSQLGGKTVGIIGFGRVGRLLARCLSGFGCRLLAADSFVGSDVLAAHGAVPAELEVIARESDFVSLHAPATPGTRQMVDKDFLRRMKPSAFLINTSRGSLVDESALVWALENGIIAGAGLDVFDREPLAADSPLLHMEQVVLTPHVSFNTGEANRNTARVAVECIAEYLRTGASANQVNELRNRDR